MVAINDTLTDAEKHDALMQKIDTQIDKFIAFYDENEHDFWQTVCLYELGVHNNKNLGANQIREVIQEYDAYVSEFVHGDCDLACKWNTFFQRFNDGEKAFNTLPESD